MTQRIFALCFFLVCILAAPALKAQTLVPHYNTYLTGNSNGFYDYLPVNYAATTEKFPLLLYLHGTGEIGSGDQTDLPKLIQSSLPKLINQGNFPSSFTVNGQSFSFIVLAPQFIQWPSPSDIDAIINYAIQNYRVNINRIYLTGISMGAGAAWEYTGNSAANASRIASMVTIAEASWPDVNRANTIAASNVSVWATHNSGDPLVPVWYTDNYIQYVNTAPQPPLVAAKKTIFQRNGHNAWTQTYDPNFTEDGMNVYQWMLQYQRSLTVLPVQLTSYQVYKAGAAAATIAWTTASEINNDHFTVERSADGNNFTPVGTVPAANAQHNYSFTDQHPLKGNNYYRLSQTDLNGATHYFDIRKIRFDATQTTLLQAYPNPVTNELVIHLEDEEKGELTFSIVGMNGSVSRQWKITKGQYEWTDTIHTDGLAAGSYLLRVKGKDLDRSQQFVKK